MRFGLLLLLLLCARVSSADVVRCYGPGGEMCSGVIVDAAGAVLTAKHCGANPVIECELPGSSELIRAVKIGESHLEEGTVVYDLDGDGYRYQPLAVIRARPGDRISTQGYPSNGPLLKLEGTLTDTGVAHGDGLFVDVADVGGVWFGWSGGPCFNSQGEVIGILSAFNPEFDPAGNMLSDATESYWIPHEDIQRVYAQARGTRVVAFVKDNCGPCERLKADVRAGLLSGYAFEFVKYDERTNTFDRHELYEEFRKECLPTETGFNVPLIWVPGTKRYTTGYSSGRVLLDFLVSIADLVRYGAPRPIPSVPDAVPERESSEVLRLVAELAELKSQLSKFRDDYAEYKESGVIGKIKAVAAMKGDAEELKRQVSEVRGSVESVRDRVKEFREANIIEKVGRVGALAGEIAELKSESGADPRAFWTGVVGFFLGPIRRRFLS